MNRAARGRRSMRRRSYRIRRKLHLQRPGSATFHKKTSSGGEMGWISPLAEGPIIASKPQLWNNTTVRPGNGRLLGHLEAVRKRGLAPVCCGSCSMQTRDTGCLSPFSDRLSMTGQSTTLGATQARAASCDGFAPRPVMAFPCHFTGRSMVAGRYPVPGNASHADTMPGSLPQYESARAWHRTEFWQRVLTSDAIRTILCLS